MGKMTPIEHTLSEKLLYRQTSKPTEPVATGFSYAEVPDWQLRQWQESFNDLQQRNAALETGLAWYAQDSIYRQGGASGPGTARRALAANGCSDV